MKQEIREDQQAAERQLVDTQVDVVSQWWRRVEEYPLLSSEQEVALKKRIEEGDAEAYEEMVTCNLRLVAGIVREYQHSADHSMSFNVLLSYGSLGLLSAIKEFDYHRDDGFSTYASVQIRQEVLRGIADERLSVRVPVPMAEAVARFKRKHLLLAQRLAEPPGEQELAVTVTLDEDDFSEWGILADDDMASFPDCATMWVLREEIEHAFSCLMDHEAEVLRLRYGLDAIYARENARTPDEVGEHLHLPPERVREIERSALYRLRRFVPRSATAEMQQERGAAGAMVGADIPAA